MEHVTALLGTNLMGVIHVGSKLQANDRGSGYLFRQVAVISCLVIRAGYIGWTHAAASLHEEATQIVALLRLRVVLQAGEVARLRVRVLLLRVNLCLALVVLIFFFLVAATAGAVHAVEVLLVVAPVATDWQPAGSTDVADVRDVGSMFEARSADVGVATIWSATIEAQALYLQRGSLGSADRRGVSEGDRHEKKVFESHRMYEDAHVVHRLENEDVLAQDVLDDTQSAVDEAALLLDIPGESTSHTCHEAEGCTAASRRSRPLEGATLSREPPRPREGASTQATNPSHPPFSHKHLRNLFS